MQKDNNSQAGTRAGEVQRSQQRPVSVFREHRNRKALQCRAQRLSAIEDSLFVASFSNSTQSRLRTHATWTFAHQQDQKANAGLTVTGGPVRPGHLLQNYGNTPVPNPQPR